MSSSSGMISVRVSCSPLRSSVLVSNPACAAIIRRMGAAPGAGVNRPTAAASATGSALIVPPALLPAPPGPTKARSTSQFLSGQLEEHVLQCARLDAQGRRQHAALGAPGGDGGEQSGLDGSVYLDEIVPGG